jgi:NRPS condensation-like uncharacterized protein
MIKLKGQARLQISRPNATVIMGCELSTSLSVEELRSCLKELVKAHPLMVKVPLTEENGEVILKQPKELVFNIISYENQTYKNIAEKHLKNEWKLGQPLIKFIINRKDRETQLIISCNHAICDGLSLVYLMEDIAAFCQDGKIPSNVESVQLHPDNMKRGFATWPFKLIAFSMSSKWKKSNVKLTSKTLSEIYETYWNNHDAKIFSLSFDSTQTKNIIETAKKRNVTVNTYLTYLLYKCQMDLPKKKYSDNFIISVSLRDKLKINPLKQLGYYVTAIRLDLSKYSLTTQNVLTDLQNRIKKQLTEKKLFITLAPYFFDGRFFDLLSFNILKLRQDKSLKKMATKQGSVKSSITISNLGLLPNKSSIKYFLPLTLVSHSYEKYVSVFTHNGEMKMAICYDPTIISTMEINTFTNSLIDKITTPVDNGYT